MYELRSARYLAADCLKQILQPGDRAIDATMGNGHDTCMLAELVGSAGHVDAFDIQPQALEKTREALLEKELLDRVSLFGDGHQTIPEHVEQKVKACCFNLGWLPGGDKSVTTRWETTKTAVEAALKLLEKGGVVTVCAYPGHDAGDEERRQLMDLLAGLRPQEYNVLHQHFLNAGPGSPECFIIQRQ